METEIVRYECDLCGAKSEAKRGMFGGMYCCRLIIGKEYEFHACGKCYSGNGYDGPKAEKTLFKRAFDKFFGKGRERKE